MYKILYVNDTPTGYAYDVNGEFTEEQATNMMKYGSVEPTEEEVNVLETETQLLRQKADAKKYLADTDWYVTRFTETGEAIPADVVEARASSRITAGGSDE